MDGKISPNPGEPDRAEQKPTVDELHNVRVALAKKIDKLFIYLIITVGLTVVILLGLGVFGFFTKRTMDATVLAGSVQVALGMVSGFVFVYFGLMMTWLGITEAYLLKGSLNSGGTAAEGALKSASPGLVFGLAGMVLIAVSLHKKIEYSEGGWQPTNSSYGDGTSGPVEPKAPLHKNVDGAEAPKQCDGASSRKDSVLPKSSSQRVVVPEINSQGD